MPYSRRSQLIRRPWFWVALLLGLLLVLGFWLGPGYFATAGRLERLRAAGLPTTPAELDRWYAAVPPEQNMAIPLLDAATALRSSSDTNLPFLGRASWPPRGQPIPEPARSLMRAFVTNNQEALAAVHLALQKPQARFPVDLTRGYVAQVPHLVTVKRTANALALEAWLAADQQDSKRAVESLLDGLRLAGALLQEPLPISGLVGLACQAIACRATEQVLSAGIFNDTELQTLQNAFQRAATNQQLTRGLVGELAMASQLRSFSTSNVLAWAGPAQVATWEEQFEGAKLRIYAAASMSRRDYAFVVKVLDDYREAQGQEFPQRLRTAKRIGDEAENRMNRQWLPLARVVIPSLSQYASRECKNIADLRSAATACAIERFRLAHTRQMPESLTELVPTFMDEVPRDPVVGQPLRYRPLTNGYVIYSVGENERDDGGIERAQRSKKVQDSGWDDTFTVEHVRQAKAGSSPSRFP